MSAGRLSLSHNSPTVIPKQTDTELPQWRKSHPAHQELNTQKKNSDTKEDFGNPKTNNQPSKKQVKRNDKAKGKNQILPKMDQTPVKTNQKIKPEDRQESISPTIKANDCNSLSSKDKVLC